MSETVHLHKFLNATGTQELKSWVQEKIGPYVGKPALESCEGYHQAYDNIQNIIQSFRVKMLAVMGSGTLEPAVWFLINDQVQHITNGDEIYCLGLYHNLLNYCASCVEPTSPPVKSDDLDSPPSPKKSRSDDDDKVQPLELLDPDVLLDGLPLSLEYDKIIASIMGETDFVEELTPPPPYDLPEEPLLMTQAFDSSKSKYYEEIQSEVRRAKAELDRWKKNQQWKQADFAQVRPEINEKNLDTLQETHDGIFDLMKLIPITESRELLKEIAPNLLVITKQPECQNDGRVISKKFDCSVRLLLSIRHLRQLKYEVKAEVLNQDSCPVSRTNAGKPFKLEHSSSPLKVQNGAITADFSITCKEHPKRLDWIDKSIVPKTVLDENFWIRFQVELEFATTQETLLVTEVSFPVKFVVNVSQCLQAYETLIWDNAAGNFGIQPVAARPETLPYKSVIQAINTRTYLITGRPLVDQDFDVIAKKLFRDRNFGEGSEVDQDMSLEEFRMKMPVNDLELDVNSAHTDDKNKISFWGWFFYLTKFIKVHLQVEDSDKRVYSLWTDMKVMGYIDTQTARVILSNCAVGTFLLRFSQTTPNAIALDWIDETGIYSYRATSKDLETRNLPDRIMDISKWKYLYSLFSSDNTPKESAFISMALGGVSFDPLSPPRIHYASRPPPPENQNFNPKNVELKTKTAIGYVRALLQLKLLSMPGTENNI